MTHQLLSVNKNKLFSDVKRSTHHNQATIIQYLPPMNNIICFFCVTQFEAATPHVMVNWYENADIYNSGFMFTSKCK